MAELLILNRNRGRTQFRGDVVCAVDDGHEWGSAEVGPNANDYWFRVVLPGVPREVFKHMLEPILFNGVEIFYRRVGLNLDLLPLFPTLEQLLAARVEKAVIPMLT